MTEHRDITPEEEALLQQALQNLGAYITEQGQPQYVLIDDNDLRNEDGYSTCDVGMEPIPGDQTWKSTAINVTSIEIND